MANTSNGNEEIKLDSKPKKKKKFSPKKELSIVRNNNSSVNNDFINFIGEHAVYHYQNYLLSEGLGVNADLKNRPQLSYGIFVDLKRLFNQAECFTRTLLPAVKNQRFVFNSSRPSDQQANCFYSYVYSYLKSLFSGVFRETYNLKSNNGFLLEGHFVYYCLLDGRSFTYGATNNNIPVAVDLKYTKFQKENLVEFLISSSCMKPFKAELEEFRDNNYTYFNHIMYETVLQNLSVAEHSDAIGKLRLRDYDSMTNDFKITKPETNPLGNSCYSVDCKDYLYVYSQATQLKFDDNRSSFICRALFIKLISTGQMPPIMYTKLPARRNVDFYCRCDVHAIAGIKSNSAPANNARYSNGGGILYGDKIVRDDIDGDEEDQPK
jgi:hypothetical protein